MAFRVKLATHSLEQAGFNRNRAKLLSPEEWQRACKVVESLIKDETFSGYVLSPKIAVTITVVLELMEELVAFKKDADLGRILPHVTQFLDMVATSMTISNSEVYDQLSIFSGALNVGTAVLNREGAPMHWVRGVLTLVQCALRCVNLVNCNLPLVFETLLQGHMEFVAAFASAIMAHGKETSTLSQTVADLTTDICERTQDILQLSVYNVPLTWDQYARWSLRFHQGKLDFRPVGASTDDAEADGLEDGEEPEAKRRRVMGVRQEQISWLREKGIGWIIQQHGYRGYVFCTELRDICIIKGMKVVGGLGFLFSSFVTCFRKEKEKPGATKAQEQQLKKFLKKKYDTPFGPMREPPAEVIMWGHFIQILRDWYHKSQEPTRTEVMLTVLDDLFGVAQAHRVYSVQFDLLSNDGSFFQYLSDVFKTDVLPILMDSANTPKMRRQALNIVHHLLCLYHKLMEPHIEVLWKTLIELQCESNTDIVFVVAVKLLDSFAGVHQLDVVLDGLLRILLSVPEGASSNAVYIQSGWLEALKDVTGQALDSENFCQTILASFRQFMETHILDQKRISDSVAVVMDILVTITNIVAASVTVDDISYKGMESWCNELSKVVVQPVVGRVIKSSEKKKARLPVPIQLLTAVLQLQYALQCTVHACHGVATASLFTFLPAVSATGILNFPEDAVPYDKLREALQPFMAVEDESATSRLKVVVLYLIMFRVNWLHRWGCCNTRNRKNLDQKEIKAYEEELPKYIQPITHSMVPISKVIDSQSFSLDASWNGDILHITSSVDEALAGFHLLIANIPVLGKILPSMHGLATIILSLYRRASTAEWDTPPKDNAGLSVTFRGIMHGFETAGAVWDSALLRDDLMKLVFHHTEEYILGSSNQAHEMLLGITNFIRRAVPEYFWFHSDCSKVMTNLLRADVAACQATAQSGQPTDNTCRLVCNIRKAVLAMASGHNIVPSSSHYLQEYFTNLATSFSVFPGHSELAQVTQRLTKVLARNEANFEVIAGLIRALCTDAAHAYDVVQDFQPKVSFFGDIFGVLEEVAWIKKKRDTLKEIVPIIENLALLKSLRLVFYRMGIGRLGHGGRKMPNFLRVYLKHKEKSKSDHDSDSEEEEQEADRVESSGRALLDLIKSGKELKNYESLDGHVRLLAGIINLYVKNHQMRTLRESKAISQVEATVFNLVNQAIQIQGDKWNIILPSTLCTYVRSLCNRPMNPFQIKSIIKFVVDLDRVQPDQCTKILDIVIASVAERPADVSAFVEHLSTQLHQRRKYLEEDGGQIEDFAIHQITVYAKFLSRLLPAGDIPASSCYETSWSVLSMALHALNMGPLGVHNFAHPDLANINSLEGISSLVYKCKIHPLVLPCIELIQSHLLKFRDCPFQSEADHLQQAKGGGAVEAKQDDAVEVKWDGDIDGAVEGQQRPIRYHLDHRKNVQRASTLNVVASVLRWYEFKMNTIEKLFKRMKILTSFEDGSMASTLGESDGLHYILKTPHRYVGLLPVCEWLCTTFVDNFDNLFSVLCTIIKTFAMARKAIQDSQDRKAVRAFEAHYPHLALCVNLTFTVLLHRISFVGMIRSVVSSFKGYDHRMQSFHTVQRAKSSNAEHHIYETKLLEKMAGVLDVITDLQLFGPFNMSIVTNYVVCEKKFGDIVSEHRQILHRVIFMAAKHLPKEGDPWVGIFRSLDDTAKPLFKALQESYERHRDASAY